MTRFIEPIDNYVTSSGRIESAFFNLKEAQCTAVRTFKDTNLMNPDIWFFCSQNQEVTKEAGFNIFENKSLSEEDFAKTLQSWINKVSPLQKTHIHLVLTDTGAVSLIQKILENLYNAN